MSRCLTDKVCTLGPWDMLTLLEHCTSHSREWVVWRCGKRLGSVRGQRGLELAFGFTRWVTLDCTDLLERSVAASVPVWQLTRRVER